MSALAKAHERRFGIEIECGNDNGYTWVSQQMRANGFRVGNGYPNGVYNVGSDGSGVEVRTPILQGREGFREMKRIFGFLNSINCFVTTRDGMHVHHEALELVDNPALCLKLLDQYVANRDTIREMVAPIRHNSGACPTWSQGYVEQLREYVETLTPRPNPRYRPNSRFANEREPTIVVSATGSNRMPTAGRSDMNLSSLREHGTVEWRLHEGSLNYDQARAWVMFVQKFMHSAIGGATPISARNRQELLQRIRLTKKERETIDDKIARRTYPDRNGGRYRG